MTVQAIRKPRITPQDPAIGRHRMAASGAESFWAWRRQAAEFADVACDADDAITGFRAEIDVFPVGNGAVARMACSGQVVRRSPFTVARNRLDHYLVQACRSGGYAGRIGADEVLVQPGDIAIVDTAGTLHVRTQRLDMIGLMIPRAVLTPFVTDPEALHGVVLPARSPQSRLLSQHLESLHACAGALGDADGTAILQASATLIAACTASITAGRAASGTTAVPSAVRMLRAIDNDLADPELSAERLVRQFGLSRAALYRLFAPYGGVATYIRGQRLKRCFAEITSPAGGTRRIAAVAEKWGFVSEAVFSRSFRATFGMSPREARRAAIAGRIGPAPFEKTATPC